MAMSSFLMNSSPYVEPKFPPSEEYSQNNYIPAQHGEDYYQRQVHQNYASYMRDSRVVHPHYGSAGGERQQGDSFSPQAHGGYHHHGGGGGGAAAAGRPGSNPVGVGVSTGGVTPVDSHGLPATGGQPYPSPVHPHSDSPNSVPSPSPGPNTPVNGVTPCPQGNSGPAVIYPWMKRVHCGQSGKSTLFFTFKNFRARFSSESSKMRVYFSGTFPVARKTEGMMHP